MIKNAFTSTFDIDYIRSDFPTLRRQINENALIYFDSGASALKPQIVIDSVSEFYQTYYSNVHRGVHSLSQEATNAFEDVRDKIHKFLNSSLREEIIFTSGTTEAINLVAQSFSRAFMQAGDEILITEMEHHANIVSWQIIAKERNLNLKVIPINDVGELQLDQLDELITKKTKLIACTHTSNVLGTINPIKKIVDIAHKKNVAVLVDGAQAVPHQKVDIQELQADFYTFSGHKLFGPTGVGVLYGKKQYLEEMPPIMGGGDMIDRVTFTETTYNDLPHKFEAGTPNIAGFIGLGAAIDYVTSIGLNQIKKYEQQLSEYMLNQLKNIKGLHLLGQAKDRASVFSFVIDGIHPLDLGTLLNEYGIAIRTGHHCCQPLMHRLNISASARASLSFYNTKQEIDVFIEKLLAVKKLLQ